jgi:hypothetical protein
VAVDDEAGLTAAGCPGGPGADAPGAGSPLEQKVFSYPYGARNDTLVVILEDLRAVPRG